MCVRGRMHVCLCVACIRGAVCVCACVDMCGSVGVFLWVCVGEHVCLCTHTHNYDHKQAMNMDKVVNRAHSAVKTYGAKNILEVFKLYWPIQTCASALTNKRKTAQPHARTPKRTSTHEDTHARSHTPRRVPVAHKPHNTQTPTLLGTNRSARRS